MRFRNETTDGRITVGSRVFVRTDALGDSPYWDVVRRVFTQTILRQPYAPNEDVEALVLTTRSWCKVSDVLIVESPGSKEVVNG